MFSYPRGVAKSERNHSWNVQNSMKYCDRTRIPLPLLTSIRDYGPVISAALKMLHELGGGALTLSNGVYYVQSPIEIHSFTCLLGGGSATTLIKVRPDSPSFHPKKGVVRASKANHVVIHGISINGNKKNQRTETQKDLFGRFGVHLSSCKYVWMKDVSVYNNYAAGINVHGSSTVSSSHVAIQRLFVDRNGGDGISFSNTRHASIAGGSLSKNGRHGVSIRGGKNILLRKISLLENGRKSKGCGVSVSGKAYSVRLEDVYIGDSPRAGVCTKDSKDISVFRSVVNNTMDKNAYCFHLTNAESFSDEETVCNDGSGKKFNKNSGMNLTARFSRAF